MKIETSTILVLDSVSALQSKSYGFIFNSSHSNMSIQKGKQKGIQHTPGNQDY